MPWRELEREKLTQAVDAIRDRGYPTYARLLRHRLLDRAPLAPFAEQEGWTQSKAEQSWHRALELLDRELDDEITFLLRRMEQGGSEARERVFEWLLPELKRSVRHWPQSVGEVSTLVSEALTRLLQAQARKRAGARPVRWRSRAHLLGYATKTVRNLVREMLRKRANHRLSEQDQRRVLQPMVDTLSKPVGSALQTALEDLHRADPEAHQAVLLRAMMGASSRETMHALEASRSTVSRHLRRGLFFLHATLIGPAIGIDRAPLQPRLTDLRRHDEMAYRALVLRKGMGLTLRESALVLDVPEQQVVSAETHAMVEVAMAEHGLVENGDT